MKCSACQALKLRSRVELRPGIETTAMGGSERYYDEDGRWHVHDVNWLTERFTCSAGHAWTVRSRTRCPEGDFGGERQTVWVD
jgi:hypothetical protein